MPQCTVCVCVLCMLYWVVINQFIMVITISTHIIVTISHSVFNVVVTDTGFGG